MTQPQSTKPKVGVDAKHLQAADTSVRQLLEILVEQLDTNGELDEETQDILLNMVIDGKRYRLFCSEVEDEIRLSPREQEVAYHLSQGYLVKEVARMLDIEKSTVTTYVSRIYNKLNVSTRADMVRVVLMRDLAQAPS